MKIVVKIGGSVSIGSKGPNFPYFKKLLPVLRKAKQGNQLIVVVGGGKLTRCYGKSVGKFKLTNREKEKIFIPLITANVIFLSTLLKMKPILALEDVDSKTSGVIGSIAPGRSTDANGAIAARKIRADLFIKLTDVNGIYNKDPHKFKNAKLIRKMPFSDLSKFAKKGSPNSYGILDAAAINTLSRSRIRTIIINGKSPKNILKVLKGEKIGTVIG